MNYLSHLECALCGKVLDADRLWNLCPECGKPLQVQKLCTECGAKIPASAKFCPECGAGQT